MQVHLAGVANLFVQKDNVSTGFPVLNCSLEAVTVLSKIKNKNRVVTFS